MHKIKLLVIIVLILFPLILILSDIYGTFPSVQRKKNTSDFRFKNKEIDNKMVEA